MAVSAGSNMNGEVAGNVTEEETLNENTLRFSPPPDQKIVDSKKALEDASSQLDSLRAGHDGHSPGTITPTIEALNERMENPPPEDEEEEESGGDEKKKAKTTRATRIREACCQSDVPSTTSRRRRLVREIASPALSTREADTLTPTAHLMTPTRGLFGAGTRLASEVSRTGSKEEHR
ncbi:hypothetical protein BSL78_01201 [Apostichopus japonicus]|uniref:Uncharacterized protein n=1 Tax=Stichopus japonicus TaxID=307972 RepID=A0A2G8LNW8_STIJA|nr:hypothetical protein BSL78_01201 [Apostichopus japonicus]